MYFLHAINSDRQTRLLNVLGQIAMILGDKKILRISRQLTVHTGPARHSINMQTVHTASTQTDCMGIVATKCL